MQPSRDWRRHLQIVLRPQIGLIPPLQRAAIISNQEMIMDRENDLDDTEDDNWETDAKGNRIQITAKRPAEAQREASAVMHVGEPSPYHRTTLEVLHAQGLKDALDEAASGNLCRLFSDDVLGQMEKLSPGAAAEMHLKLKKLGLTGQFKAAQVKFRKQERDERALWVRSNGKAPAIEVLRSALLYVTPTSQEDCLNVGVALKNVDPEKGLSVFQEYCEEHGYFKNEDLEAKYDGIDPNAKTDLSATTIVTIAKKNGWETGWSEKSAVSKIRFPDMRGELPDPNSKNNIVAYMEAERIVPCTNEFDGHPYIRQTNGDLIKFDEIFARDLRMRMNSEGLRVAKEFFYDAILWMADQVKFHPVRAYLKELGLGLGWDGKPRLDLMLSTYFGAEDTSYARLVGPKFMMGAVKRVKQPGCKVDTMLILYGPQGTNKSTAFRTLASSPFFTDGVSAGATSEELIELTSGKWIIECAELVGMGKRSSAELKQSLSKQTDVARLPYARAATEVARQFVLCGTTNDAQILSDLTGNRRFWIVSTGKIDLAAIEEDRDQLWAEAVAREAKGEPIYMASDAEIKLAADALKAFQIDDPMEVAIEGLVASLGDGLIKKSDMYAALGFENNSRSGGAVGPKVAQIMRNLGWRECRGPEAIGRQRCFATGSGTHVFKTFQPSDKRTPVFLPRFDRPTTARVLN